ncbi:MAG: carotenoid biosynthesis protein [Candidatus Roizmanbacteria bacterium]
MLKWIWRLFYLLLVVFLIYCISLASGFDLSKNIFFRWILLIVPATLFILHVIYSLGLWRSIFFVGLASGVGWAMETIGLRDGVVFGGQYVYASHSIAIGTVPISVCVYWAVFIYTGYSIVNSSLYWLHKKKPTLSKSPVYHIIPLVVLDATLVTVIDLFMDPVQVHDGAWRWLGGGAYFGIPIGNFVGWFFTASIVVGVFRLVEYFLPEKSEKKDSQMMLVPTIMYGVLTIAFSVYAARFGLYGLLGIGVSLMCPIIIANLYLYRRFMDDVSRRNNRPI